MRFGVVTVYIAPNTHTHTLTHAENTNTPRPPSPPRPHLPRPKPPHAFLHPIPLLQQPAHVLEPQPRRLRIHDVDDSPAQDANDGIQRERARRRNGLHHGQEGEADERVAGPVCAGGECGAEGAHAEGEELGLLPGDAAEADGVGGDVEEHAGEDEGGPGGGWGWGWGVVEGCCGCGWGLAAEEGQRGRRVAQVEEAECDCAAGEACGHDGHAEEQDAAPADAVDGPECDEGEEEVCDGDGERRQGRGLEAHEPEDGGGEVHEAVEAARLLEELQGACDGECAAVGADGEEVVEGGRHVGEPAFEGCVVFDARGRGLLFVEDLALYAPQHSGDETVHARSAAVDAAEDYSCLAHAPALDEEPRRVGHEDEHARLDDRGYSTQTHHPAPAPCALRERPPNNVRHDLSARDEQTADRHQSAAERARTQLADIQRDDETCTPHRSAHDTPSDDHAPHRGGVCLPQRTEDEERVSGEDDGLAAKGVGQGAGQRGEEQREEGGGGGDEGFVEGGEGAREVGGDGDEG